MFETIKRKIMTDDTIGNVRKNNPGKKIAFASGCYDILQSGHAVFFSQCKELADLLVVGVGRDSVVTALKGAGRPVNPENNRLYLVAAMHEVDYAVLNDLDIMPGKIDFASVMEKLKPDIFVLNEDDSGIAYKQELCSRIGAEIKFVRRVVPGELEPTSTTRIIDRISFSYKAPLRIDFAGGWTDVPFVMHGKTGFVSNAAIKPLIEFKSGKYNFAGYPRGSGLSTSTAVKLLEMISAKTYNVDAKNLGTIAEDLFNLENRELNWAIGRQDQYAICFGGFNCFAFEPDRATPVGGNVRREVLDEFRGRLLLIHTGVSRNAQLAVEQVYRNHETQAGKAALAEIGECGRSFIDALAAKDFPQCARIMEANFEAQKRLAPSTSNQYLDEIYGFAKENGAFGGKICGAGGGGAFVFYCENPDTLKRAIKKRFVDCFEIDFEFEYGNIKEINRI